MTSNCITLDVGKAREYGLNPSESILAAFLYSLIVKSKVTLYDGRYYYPAPYQVVADNCPILSLKSNTVYKLYKRLSEVGLITVAKINNIVHFSPSVALTFWGRKKSQPIERSSDNKTLFKNSMVTRLVTTNPITGERDYSALLSKLGDKYAYIDLLYYFDTVSDWSDMSNKKRTDNGWIATIRNFIRIDISRNKVHKKPQIPNVLPIKTVVQPCIKSKFKHSGIRCNHCTSLKDNICTDAKGMLYGLKQKNALTDTPHPCNAYKAK